MKKKLENILEEYFNNYPEMPDSKGPDKLLDMVHNQKEETTSFDLNYFEFVVSQAMFIKRKVCIAQAVLLGLCLLGVWYFDEGLWQIAWTSSILPLFIMGGIFEFSKSFSEKMSEMEFATKYTLHQLLIARVLILGLINFTEISILFIYSGQNVENFSFTILIYMSVPFLLTVFLCMLVVNRIPGKEGGFMIVAIGFFVSVSTGSLALYYPQIYRESMKNYWYIIITVTVVAIVIEVVRVLKSCSKKLDGVIGYGRMK